MLSVCDTVSDIHALQVDRTVNYILISSDVYDIVSYSSQFLWQNTVA